MLLGFILFIKDLNSQNSIRNFYVFRNNRNALTHMILHSAENLNIFSAFFTFSCRISLTTTILLLNNKYYFTQVKNKQSFDI